MASLSLFSEHSKKKKLYEINRIIYFVAKVKEKIMAKKKLWLLMLAMVLVFGFIFTGCATDIATTKRTSFARRPISLVGMPNYTILGPVFHETNWFGIFGFSRPTIGLIAGNDIYLYQSGGFTYMDLLNEARKIYPDADAVIDINIDYSKMYYFIFYGRRRNIISGIAIKYSREEISSLPYLVNKTIVQTIQGEVNSIIGEE